MKEIIYQILPRYWGSEDHRNGKFSDIDAKTLGYIKGLGVTSVWYTGIIRHATSSTEDPHIVKGDAGSPYAITDYYDVNPYLADNSDNRLKEFIDLVNRTHSEGLKVIIDFVPNHVSRAYNGSCSPKGIEPLGKSDDTSKHWSPDNDFFYYPNERLSLPNDPEGEYMEFPAKASGNNFSPSPDINDWYETIRLNYCDFHTRTWDKMYGIVRYWASLGVDGFRCDMVEMVPPQFFKWLIRRIKEEFPGISFIAEVYQADRYREYIEDVGFDLLYDKSGLYDTLRAVTQRTASAESITRCWQFLGNLQPRMLNFLENHDEQRIASDFFAGSAAKGLPSLAVSLLLNEAPFMLYAGQEIGEKGMDNEPFSGINGRTTIFDWWRVGSLSRLWNTLHDAPGGLSSEEESILSRYREILQTAVSVPAFCCGKTYDLCYCQSPSFDRSRLFAWLRSDGKKTFLIVSNFSDREVIAEILIPKDASSYLGASLPSSVSVSVPPEDYTLIQI